MVLCDVNFDPRGLVVAAVFRRGRGFHFAICRRSALSGSDLEPERGWINGLWRRSSVAKKGSERPFKGGRRFSCAKGRKEVLVSPYAPNYFGRASTQSLPGGSGFLGAPGIRTLYSPVAMDKNLVGYSVPPEIEALEPSGREEGYHFGPLAVGVHPRRRRVCRGSVQPRLGQGHPGSSPSGVPLDQCWIAVDGERGGSWGLPSLEGTTAS